MAAWKMCMLGHWYQNEKHCPVCANDDRFETGDRRPSRHEEAVPRAYPHLQIIR